MPVYLIPTILVGITLISIIIFVFRNVFSPKKIATVAQHVKQGKYTAAIRLAKQVLAKEPRNSEGHYLLGMAYKGDGKPELALMELKTVNEIGKFGGLCAETSFRAEIADLYAQFNQPEEALKEYVLLIKMEPKNAQYYYRAGLLFANREKNERAADFFRKSVELDPKHSNAHYELGLLLYRSKHTVEAKTEFDLAIKYNQDNYQAYYYAGRLLKENHDYVAALICFEKAQRDPDIKVKALVERGSCYMSLNSLDKAVTELVRAVRLIENESSAEALYARYFLSICYEKLRQFEDAIGEWELIYAKKPSFRDVAEKLSQYQDLRTDDKIKDFLTASMDEFHELCTGIVESLGFSTRDIGDIPNGCQVIALEQESKWRNARKMPRLIRFLRVADIIDLSAVRSIHEEMKKLNVMRGMIIASSRFSRSAKEYAETRPVELLDKERLQKLLSVVPASPDPTVK